MPSAFRSLDESLAKAASNEAAQNESAQNESAQNESAQNESAHNETARLAALYSYDILDAPPEAAFDRLTRLAARLFEVPVALISFIGEDTHFTKSCFQAGDHGLDAPQLPRSLSFCARTILLEADETLVVPDLRLDERFLDHPLVTGAPGVRFYAGAPLRARGGHHLGSLCLLDTRPREALSAAQRLTLTELAAVVVDALERRLAEAGLRRENAERRRTEAKLQAVIENTTDAVYIKDREGRYLLANRATGEVLGRAARDVVGRSDAELFGAEDNARITDVDAEVLRGGRAVTYERGAFVGGEERVFLTTKYPFVLPSGAGGETEGEVQGVVGMSRDITERKRMEAALARLNEDLERRVAERTAQLTKLGEQLQHDALHDALTGLPNRALFMDRLSRAMTRRAQRPENRFAALFLDLDRFKVINDSLGHGAGDELLCQIARRLESVLARSDTVARLGGDEFTVLLEDVRGEADARERTEVIERALEAPFSVAGRELHVTASIGVTLCDSITGDTVTGDTVTGDTVTGDTACERPEDVLRDADIAMYRAKAAGKARHAIFDPGMRERAVALMELEADLRFAVERGEIEAHYQPIHAVRGGELIGFEALARWRHPNIGLISPAEFIPLAEETGLIVDIDRAVLRAACAQLAAWANEGEGRETLTLSVNFSGQHFARPDVVACVRDALAGSGLTPERLKLEMTESVLAGDSGPVSEALRALRDLGVALHIDDFGTGYSSLGYLQRFCAQTLKVDRSFVNQLAESPSGAELVHTIVAMAHNLGMGVVAEGVETAQQLALLRELGCEHAQGYLFSRPLPASEVPSLWREEREEAVSGG